MWVEKFIKIHSTGHSPNFLCPKKIAFPCLKSSVNVICTQSSLCFEIIFHELTKEFWNFYVLNINNILKWLLFQLAYFQMKKMKPRAINCLDQGHTARLWFKPGSLDFSSDSLMIFLSDRATPCSFPKFICDVFRKVLFLKIS